MEAGTVGAKLPGAVGGPERTEVDGGLERTGVDGGPERTGFFAGFGSTVGDFGLICILLRL